MEKNAIVLAGPDRAVPLATRIRFLFDGLSQFGWFWLGLSSMHLRLFYVELLGAGKPVAVFMLLLFPAIGVSLIAVSTYFGWRALRLLRHGIPARGRLVRKDTTSVTVDDRRVDLTFVFTTVDGRTAQCLASGAANLEDDRREELLYDPADPAHAALLDALPGKPRLSEQGVVRSQEGRAWHLLILPVGTVLLHVFWTVLAR